MKPEYAEEMKRLRLPYTTGGETCLFDTGGRLAFNQFAFAGIAANEHFQLKQAVEELREALVSIASMPEYDQDDSHRLRNIAAEALKQTKELV
jgi:hypothetical protein